MGHVNQPLSTSAWVEIGLVDIIGEDRRDSDELSRAGRCDSHEDDQECADSATRPEKCDSSIRHYETGRYIGLGHAERVGRESWVALEGKSSKPAGCSHEPRNCKPGDTSHDVAGECMNWGSCDGFVVVAVV
jgi:hypothetical protein